MAKPFEPFEAELNHQQISLLLDTVLYFEEAPKLLALPALEQKRVSVPILPDSLRSILQALSEDEPFTSKRFHFDWEGTREEGDLLIELPDGRVIRQHTKLAAFSLM